MAGHHLRPLEMVNRVVWGSRGEVGLAAFLRRRRETASGYSGVCPELGRFVATVERAGGASFCVSRLEGYGKIGAVG